MVYTFRIFTSYIVDNQILNKLVCLHKKIMYSLFSRPCRVSRRGPCARQCICANVIMQILYKKTCMFFTDHSSPSKTNPPINSTSFAAKKPNSPKRSKQVLPPTARSPPQMPRRNLCRILLSQRQLPVQSYYR